MGFEVDEYVYPASISRKLVCAICQGVLESPVITPCEHLFWFVATLHAGATAGPNADRAPHPLCSEDELVEWLARSDQCPVCKAVVDPKHVQRPRFVCRRLGLRARCPPAPTSRAALVQPHHCRNAG